RRCRLESISRWTIRGRRLRRFFDSAFCVEINSYFLDYFLNLLTNRSTLRSESIYDSHFLRYGGFLCLLQLLLSRARLLSLAHRQESVQFMRIVWRGAGLTRYRWA